MATTKGKFIQFAIEPTFGNINAATGLPYDTGLTFDRLMAKGLDDMDTPGEYEVAESDEATDGPYIVPGEVDVKINLSGTQVPYRKGDITTSAYYRGPATGAVIASLARIPLYKILQSGLAIGADDAQGNHDTVVGNIDVNEFEPATVTRWNAGDVFAFQHEGLMRGAFVTDVEALGGGGDRVHFSPSLPDAGELTADQLLRICKTLFAATGAAMGSVGKSVACQFGTATTLTKCYGGRLKQAKFTVDAKKLLIETTVYYPYIVDDHGNAAAAASAACQPGQAARIGACPVISEEDSPDCTATPGVELTGSEIDLITNSLVITIDNELSIDEDTETCDEAIRLPADIEVSNTTISVEGELASLNETFTQIALDRDHRALLFAFGPFAEGTGMVIALPSFVFKTPSKAGLQKKKVTTPFTGAPGRFYGDDGTASATNPANSSFRIGFVNIDTP